MTYGGRRNKHRRINYDKYAKQFRDVIDHLGGGLLWITTMFPCLSLVRHCSPGKARVRCARRDGFRR